MTRNEEEKAKAKAKEKAKAKDKSNANQAHFPQKYADSFYNLNAENADHFILRFLRVFLRISAGN